MPTHSLSDSDWNPKVGEPITPDEDAPMKVIDVDDIADTVLVEFKHKGKTCTCWVPKSEVTKSN
jgi:hypothetical protein